MSKSVKGESTKTRWTHNQKDNNNLLSLLDHLEIHVTRAFNKIYSQIFTKLHSLKQFSRKVRKQTQNVIPLSMQSVPGKLLGVASTRLDEHSAIVPNQNLWRFIKGHSLELMFSFLKEPWLDTLYAGKVIGILCIDFRKVFHAIGHNMLGLKLQSNAISGDLAAWNQHYLSERKQHTEVGGIMSKQGMVQLEYLKDYFLDLDSSIYT